MFEVLIHKAFCVSKSSLISNDVFIKKEVEILNHNFFARIGTDSDGSRLRIVIVFSQIDKSVTAGIS